VNEDVPEGVSLCKYDYIDCAISRNTFLLPWPPMKTSRLRRVNYSKEGISA
jgi:hypothetical protein